MGLTNDLRNLIARELGKTPGFPYYLRADEEAAYPYKVVDISPVVYVEGGRHDCTVTVDIYDRNGAYDRTDIEDLADAVQETFCEHRHYPEKTILATFWPENRQNVADPDTSLQRIQLSFTCHVYKRGEVNG